MSQQPNEPNAKRVRAKNLYVRRCHDCGKRTTNYRCEKCWKKYRDDEALATLSPFDFVIGHL